ncbi:MAG: MBL fold metallo-hydrolase [Candidatus Omnitrophica bacterium]|nr:MBL fold metallo-hydrolase [Candidatus Omnitrophota bacterium]
MKLKVLFDKDSQDPRYASGWGLAYLLDGRLLFDTGEKGEYLLENLRVLQIDAARVEMIVISHAHWDHTGGLSAFLDLHRHASVAGCAEAENLLSLPSGTRFVPVTEGQELIPGVWTSGCLTTRYHDAPLAEQALFVKTGSGIAVLSGCAHPGILSFVELARHCFPEEPLTFVGGGFHLINRDPREIRYIADKMKQMGVQRVGPSHCSGYEAFEIFQQVFGSDCVRLKVGKEVEV